MVSINFCGDSFVASDSPLSWCVQLATLLNAKIIGLGKKGSATEHAINSFDSTADYTIFAWTEANRLYHPKYSINTASVEENNLPIYKAAKLYYKFLHSFEDAEEKQRRLLYWFDHEILSQYQGKVIHLWGFKQTYEFKNGFNFVPELSHWRNDEQRVANHFTREQNIEFCNTLYPLCKQ